MTKLFGSRRYATADRSERRFGTVCGSDLMPHNSGGERVMVQQMRPAGAPRCVRYVQGVEGAHRGKCVAKEHRVYPLYV